MLKSLLFIMENTEKTLPLALVVNKELIFSLTALSAFAVPFALGHPQLLVGAIVNAALFSTALHLPEKFIRPIIFLPGLAVLSRGLIFGPLTSFLIIFLPFIWLGNWILTLVFKKLFNFGFWPAMMSASLLKAGFLYSCAFLLIKAQIFPRSFLVSMGQIQLITALTGGGLAFLISRKYLTASHNFSGKIEIKKNNK